jgi:hypothetical protein
MRMMIALCLLLATHVYAQTKPEQAPNTYRFIVDYYTLDMKGQIRSREQVSAIYTRDLPGNQARWSDVGVAVSSGSAQTLGTPTKRAFMEGFSYKAGDEGILQPEFFKGFPAAPEAMVERNLVWDTRMFEFFVQDNFEHLIANPPYHVPGVAEVPIPGLGNFKHKDVQLLLTGTTKRNGEDCTVIDYQAFFNEVDLRLTPTSALVGRSHYWGQIWVSTKTHRIEYATLYEDVLGDIGGQTVNVFRIGTLERTNR